MANDTDATVIDLRRSGIDQAVVDSRSVRDWSHTAGN
jgi:hypothetical protein